MGRRATWVLVTVTRTDDEARERALEDAYDHHDECDCWACRENAAERSARANRLWGQHLAACGGLRAGARELLGDLGEDDLPW